MNRSEPAPRILVCFYSMTGNTRRLALEIQQATGGQLEEIREAWPRRGLVGVIRALADVFTKRKPPLLPAKNDPDCMDLLILGGPIWARRLASPVRAYAGTTGRRAHQVAFFCTEGATGSDGAFADLEVLCGRERIASLVVDRRHLDGGAHRAALDAFLKRIALPLHGLARADYSSKS